MGFIVGKVSGSANEFLLSGRKRYFLVILRWFIDPADGLFF